MAERYAGWLADQGVLRGLIGPREVHRLWERHLINCALLGEAVPHGVDVCDIGTGAGLPGVVLALGRPDLSVTLVEPLLRRTTFLEEVVADLGLENVEVVRARAEELHGRRTFTVVTSRAVAPLDRLARWSLPLVREGGWMLAMKGSAAEEEVTTSAGMLTALGGEEIDVLRYGEGLVEAPTTVVRIAVGSRVGRNPAGATRSGRKKGRASDARSRRRREGR